MCGAYVRRSNREQRGLLAALGVVVERPAKGNHTLLYCSGPSGQRFMVIVQNSPMCGRARENFAARIRKALKSA
jgi:hypothetical protein